MRRHQCFCERHFGQGCHREQDSSTVPVGPAAPAALWHLNDPMVDLVLVSCLGSAPPRMCWCWVCPSWCWAFCSHLPAVLCLDVCKLLAVAAAAQERQRKDRGGLWVVMLSSPPGQDLSGRHRDSRVWQGGRARVHPYLSLFVSCLTPQCLGLGQVQYPPEHNALSPAARWGLLARSRRGQEWGAKS